MELLESVGEVLLKSGSAKLFFAKKVYDRSSPGAKSSPDEDCGFYCRCTGGGAETSRGTVDGETGFMTKDDRFFVGLSCVCC